MNANEIYKKYVLKEQPRTLQGTNVELLILDEVASLPSGPRQSDRTAMEIQSLTPNSYFVSATNNASFCDAAAAYLNLGIDNINFISLARYIEYRHILGKIATSGEMVGFDHTVYDRLTNKDIFDDFLYANNQYIVCGYKVKLYDSVMKQLHKRHYPV